jgi:transaldolase
VQSKWLELEQYGQSVWYDNVARPALESGLLERIMREDGVSGGTSNPSIFANAVTGSDLYDDDIRAAGPDESAQAVFERCAITDIQRACDLMRPIWERTEGHDGYISLEVEADLAFEEDATVDRAHRLRALVDRPNVMIKVPGTAPGVAAFRRLTREGVSINVTLLFSVERYREVAEAYAQAIQERVEAGEPVDAIASVASFFVSRIDTKVDKLLPEGSELRGKAAVANAKIAYADVYEQIFAGAGWERLAAAGANEQRPLWASTSTKNPAYSPTLYVDTLIGKNTVNTVPDATLEAYRTAGEPRPDTIKEGLDEARATMRALAEAGVDFAQVTDELEREGVKAFADAYDGMLEAIQEKREAIGVR